MDIFLTAVAGVIVLGLLYTAWTEWLKASHEQKLFMIDTLVAAAQQLYGNDPGSMRFDWVVQRFRERWPHMDEAELEALVEAAVYRLKLFAGRIPVDKEIDKQNSLYWLGTGRHN